VLRIADIRLNGKSAAAGIEKPANAKADERRKVEEAAARQAAEDAALAAKLAVAAPAEGAAPEVAAPDAAAPETEAAETEAAETKSSRAFEIYEDKAGQWRWRLRARNGELVAMSEQGFTTKAGVVRALDVVRRNTAEAEGHEEIAPAEDGGETKTAKGFEIYEDKSGHWRWRLRAGNGELLAIPEQGFTTKAGVVRALDVVRRNVAEADAHEEAASTESSTTEAAPPKRTRAKKDE